MVSFFNLIIFSSVFQAMDAEHVFHNKVQVHNFTKCVLDSSGCIDLSSIVNIFNSSISEQQAWAILFQVKFIHCSFFFFFMALGIYQVTYNDRKFCSSVLVLLVWALPGKLGQ